MTLDSMRVALRGIVANRLRSALTMLGILIGTASVILLVAVGTGIANQVQVLGKDGHTTETRQVTTGLKGDDDVEITSGLDVGDKVVVTTGGGGGQKAQG